MWVEWAGEAHSDNSPLTLRPVAGSPAGLPQDVVRFHTFTSIVVALGGEFEDPIANRGQGTFQTAIALYEGGYDVYMHDEDDVNGQGFGAVYDEIVTAIRARGVGGVAVFGYSHGGGSTFDLVNRLVLDRDAGRIVAFTIPFSAYVDAVTTGSVTQENRRPPSMYHANYYQRGTEADFFLDGGPIPAAEAPAATTFQLDVETRPWGLNTVHLEIDDLAQVITGIHALLVPRVAR
ncbi:MAG: hypothetical protein ACKV2Q_25540 [Planctomycetaceae bacterium]